MFEVIEGVWVEGNRITHVGRVEDGKESPKFDKEIDAEGNLMPVLRMPYIHL